ncbi:GNAT family N-acetyltransferase [Ferruginibacter sp.]|nr:GNAT family N-acetyltransferase [Ferruginibacter sp.]
MPDLTLYKNDFCISTSQSKLDMQAIHQFLSKEAYWSKGIPFNKVVTAAEKSLNFGLYLNEKQIGYARIISDFATIAYLGDVYVLPEFRGRGLSKWLMQTIQQHPDLQGLRRWILLTGDAHGLYRQFGFTPIAAPEKWMELHNKNVYSK